jgi:hypothetical protein
VNSIHDMGGMHGLGAVDAGPDEAANARDHVNLDLWESCLEPV